MKSLLPWERTAACPRCGSTRPHAALFPLVSTTWRWFGLHTAPTGQVLRCQVGKCDCVFEVHKNGTVLERDPLAFPRVQQNVSVGETQPNGAQRMDPRELAHTERALRSRGPLTPLAPPPV